MENYQSNPWTRITCNDEPCKATLTISNPTEKESGLYRCSIQPYKPNDEITLQIQVVKTFQLDVISDTIFRFCSKIECKTSFFFLDFTISAPELIDDLPANTTALIDSQVVLQCRVRSKVQPSIKWFRQQDSNSELPIDENNNYNSRVIQYFENTYELLESAGEKILTDDTYLSKLILNNVSERDTGFYVCVGINYRGFKIRQAFLNVIYPDDSELHSQSSKEFYLLFLIPVGLAIIPIILWCIYCTVKYLSRTKTAKHRTDNKSHTISHRNIKYAGVI